MEIEARHVQILMQREDIVITERVPQTVFSSLVFEDGVREKHACGGDAMVHGKEAACEADLNAVTDDLAPRIVEPHGRQDAFANGAAEEGAMPSPTCDMGGPPVAERVAPKTFGCEGPR